MKHPIRRRLMYLGFQGLRFLIARLPLPVARAMGRGLGALAYLVVGKERRRTQSHLAASLPGLPAAERRRIAWETFKGIGQTAAEWLSPACWDLQRLDKMIDCEGLEHLRQAHAGGNGGVVVTPHLGNWELIAPYVRLKGCAPTVLARRLRYPEYESFLINLRGACGVSTLARGALKDVAQALRANQLVGMLPDQDVQGFDGIFVDFFGRPAHTLIGPAALALMTGAPLIPVFMIRQGARYRLVITPPIKATPGVDRHRAIAEMTEAWSRIFEGMIRQYPEQWVWMHRRWRTQPAQAATPVRPELDPGAGTAQPSLALLATCVLALAIGMAGCDKPAPPPPERAEDTAPPPPADANADSAMSGFTLTGYTDDGGKEWQLNGQNATVDGSTVTIIKPDGIGYDPDRQAFLTAGAAMVNQTNRHVRLEHEVTVHTSDGLWLTAPVLHWIPDQQHVATDTPVRIETDHMLLRGRGFVGDSALKDAVIERDIEMVLNPSDKEPVGVGKRQVTITCDGPLNFDYAKSIATFEQNVHVQDPNGDLFSDKLVAHLDQVSHTIKYAEATGNVRIVQHQNTALSNKAIYEPAVGKITLHGKPSLLLYPDEQAKAPEALQP